MKNLPPPPPVPSLLGILLLCCHSCCSHSLYSNNRKSLLTTWTMSMVLKRRVWTCRKLSLVLINACCAKGRVFLTLSLSVDHVNRDWGVTVISSFFCFCFFGGSSNQLSLDTEFKCKKSRWGDKMLISNVFWEEMFVSFMSDSSCSFLEVVTLKSYIATIYQGQTIVLVAIRLVF